MYKIMCIILYRCLNHSVLSPDWIRCYSSDITIYVQWSDFQGYALGSIVIFYKTRCIMELNQTWVELHSVSNDFHVNFAVTSNCTRSRQLIERCRCLHFLLNIITMKTQVKYDHAHGIYYLHLHWMPKHVNFSRIFLARHDCKALYSCDKRITACSIIDIQGTCVQYMRSCNRFARTATYNTAESHCYRSHCITTWWRHRMETFSALLAICAGNSPVPGAFPARRPVTRGFDVFFDLRPNERLSKHS